MIDREKVIEWLADTELYYRETGKTENELYQSEMAHNAIKLLKEQDTDIGNLNETVKNLLNAYTEIKAIYGDSVRVVGELVRCKDCKHRDPEDKKCDCGHAIRWQLPRPDNWFCADGERKEGR